MSDLTPSKLAELRRLAATAADATTERTPWYSADDLLTHGIESEDDAPYIAALTPPIVLELLDAAELLATVRDQVTHGALCPMCSTGMVRRTVGLVCQLCGTDYRPETATTEATGAPVTLAGPDAMNPPPNPSAAVTGPHSTEGA